MGVTNLVYLRKAIDDQGNRRRMINGGNKFSVWKKGY